LLAAVTDPAGAITGIHRTWLDPARLTKAPVTYPRKALGHLLGNGVRFGPAGDVLAAGEGIETVLALQSAFSSMPLIAALSAGHLAALDLQPLPRRLYIARDNDAAGNWAAIRLRERYSAAGVDVRILVPDGSDFNADLQSLGAARHFARLLLQLDPSDRPRFANSAPHRAA
jgi:hypothetical protein